MIFSTLLSHANADVTVSGELQALKSDSYSPPKVKDIWQYTIAFMVEDGSVVKQGMPVLMFKTDAIQTKLVNAQGKLGIKLSELKNKNVNQVETLEKKSILIEEKKMELDKASRKSELPQSLLSKNDFYENKLRFELAQKDYASTKLDLVLTKQKSKTEEKILKAEIDKLKAEIEEFSQSIASMKMFSKSEGIAMHKSSWNGNKFAIGDTVWGGQRVVEVANLSQIIAKLEIKESSVKHILLGQKVKIKLDSLPDKEFLGTIETLAKVVKIKSKNQPSKVLEAIVFIDNVDTEIMRPGMRLSAEIETNGGKQ